ncbi:MAG: TRAP transporter substrate-binding protein [Gammaproteobacteria bacterium]|nr:TRAP transporter substrate-binding protein [Gammaproteobacteria bacterium]
MRPLVSAVRAGLLCVARATRSSAILCLALSIVALPTSAATFRLKFGTENAASHPVSKAMDYFAKKVEADSGGEIKVATFPGEALGKARDMVEMVQLGTLDICTVTAGVVSNFVPAMDFFALPFLWQDQDHLQRAVDGELGEILKAEMAKSGLLALGFSTSGARQLYTNKTITGLEDVKGLKVRTMKVPQIVDTWKELGAIPVPVAWGEVYQALQTGLVDAAESSFLGWISQ